MASVSVVVAAIVLLCSLNMHDMMACIRRPLHNNIIVVAIVHNYIIHYYEYNCIYNVIYTSHVHACITPCTYISCIILHKQAHAKY